MHITKYIVFLALLSLPAFSQCGTLVKNPITKMWDCAGSSGGSSSSIANATATSVGAVTSLAIDISSLNVSSLSQTIVQCWTGASAPFTEVAITSLNPASTSSITANFSSTANITCRVNATGGTGETGPAGPAGSYTIGNGIQQVGDEISVDTAVVPTKAVTNTLAEKWTFQKGVNVVTSVAPAVTGDLGYSSGRLKFFDASALQTLMNDPFTTRGDLVIQGASGPARLAAGASGLFLMANGAASDPSYQTPNASQVTNAFDKSTGNTIATGAQDFTSATSFTVPNSAAPTVSVFGQLAGDNNLWAASRGAPVFYDGTASVALIGTLVSDTPSNGQVPIWNTGGTITWETPNAGTVTTVGWTGGIVSIANATTTPAFTIAGTSGGIPYFSSSSAWASSAALASTAVVVGGGAGSAPVSRSGITIDSNMQIASVVTSQSGVREAVLYSTVSDASGAALAIGNMTQTNAAFSPGFVGRAESSSRAGIIFRGGTTTANDTGTASLVGFQAMLIDGADILNGTLGLPTVRPAYSFTYGNAGILALQMESSGQWNMGQTAYSGKVSNVSFGLFDATATTGITREIIQAGAGQSTTNLWETRANNATLGSGTLLSSFNAVGRLIAGGTAPSVSSCGTSPTIAGFNEAGRVTVGTGGVASSCTVTFGGTAWVTAPACWANNETTTLLAKAVATTTTVIISSATPFTASDVISFGCKGY